MIPSTPQDFSKQVSHIKGFGQLLPLQLWDALKYLQDQGKVGWIKLRDPQLFFVQTKTPKRLPPGHPPTTSLSNWHSLAYELSLLLGGVFWYGPSSISWKYGPYSIFLQDKNKERDIWAARALTYEITSISDLPFSIAGCARKLLEWVGVTDRTKGENFVRDINWHFAHCTPGTAPSARIFDVKGCYRTILGRLPSPLFNTRGDGEISFVPLEKHARKRWRQVVESLYQHKGLGNSFVGNMVGPSPDGKGVCYYHNGDKRPGPKIEGPFRNAGLLITRTTYELTAEAVAEQYQQGEECLHAYSDGLITTAALPPNAWQRVGLKVRCLAEGDADVRSVGVYRVGDDTLPKGHPQKGHATKPYQFGRDYYGKTRWCEFGDRLHRPDEPSLVVTVKGPHWGRWLDNIKIPHEEIAFL